MEASPTGNYHKQNNRELIQLKGSRPSYLNTRTQDRAIEQPVDVPIILLYYLFVINDVEKILEISKNLAPQHWIIFPCYLTRQVLPHFSLAETSPVATSSPEAVPRAILSASFNTTMETWTKVCKYQHQHLLVLVMLLHLDYPLGN